MALQVAQDQNNVASIGLKANVSKAPRKGALGGRTPLGNLSNSLNPSVNQPPKKQNLKVSSFLENENGASIEASKKKVMSKSSMKGQPRTRKALSDISNAQKPALNVTSKKGSTVKLSAVFEEPIDVDVIAEEGFLHNHEECIKAQNRDMNVDQFLRTIGLDCDLPKEMKIPKVNPGSNKANCSTVHSDLEEMKDMQLMDDENWKLELSNTRLASSPPCPTLLSPKYSLQLEDIDLNFSLTRSP